MEFRILGPLEVREDGAPVALGPAKQRALLGVLLLRANEVVSSERLVDELWGEQPPASAGKLVQAYVSQLRRALESHVVVTRAPGYVAEIDADSLDASRFLALVAAADARWEEDKLEEAAAAYQEALALWRGPVLADVTFESSARTETERLEEVRRAALVHRIECELALGRHAQLVGELESLVNVQPYDERFRAQLMLALYRAGRQSDALAAYRGGRERLARELGLEPGPELQRLEHAILVHDPALAPPRRTVRGRRRRVPAIAAGLVVAAAATAALLAALLMRDPAPPVLTRVVADSVAVVDPERNALVADLPLHTRPWAIAFGRGSFWIAAADDGTLLQLDPRTRKVTRTIGIGVHANFVAVGGGNVWALSATERTLVQVDAATGSVVRKVRLTGRVRVGTFKGLQLSTLHYIAVGGGAAWVSSGLDVLLRVDARTGAVEQLAVPSTGGVTFDGESVWAARGYNDSARRHPGEAFRVDPASRRILGRIAPPPLEGGTPPWNLVFGAGALWGISEPGGTVWKLDPVVHRVVAFVQLSRPGRPLDVAVGEGAVWTANDDGTVSRLDPATATLEQTIPVGRWPRAAYPVGVAVGAGAVWVILR